MSSLLGGGVFLLVALPVIIAQWIGVVKIAKLGRSGEWWCMLVGTALTSLGPIIHGLGFAFMSMPSSSSGSTMSSLMVFFMISGGLATLGSLLFAVGFAIHGYKLANLRDRITELEMITLAQATELEQRRNP